jgi:hypothetical protein
MSAATSIVMLSMTCHQPCGSIIFNFYDDLNTSYDILDHHNMYDEYCFITKGYDWSLIRMSHKVFSDTLSMTFIFSSP